MGINGGLIISLGVFVIDDWLFDGEVVEFLFFCFIFRGSVDIDLEIFGFYMVGDIIIVKWMIIDEVYFDFWNIVEFNMAN